MPRKILSRKKSRTSKPKSKKVTFSNLLGGKSDYYQPGKYPFNSAQFFKKSNITTIALVKKSNLSTPLTSKNVKPAPLVPAIKNSNSKLTKIGGHPFQDPANALFTSNSLKTTNARGTVIDTDKFNRQWSLRKQYANYPMNVGIYSSSMPAAKSSTGGGSRRYKKSAKTRSKSITKKRGRKPKSRKTHSKRR